MKIYSYVVARDYGFAPNPFHGICTLATCKPKIRKSASVGDYVVGLTPRADGNKICYIMQVGSKISFDQYWIGSNFQVKKPLFNKTHKYSVGDNIYHKKADGFWHQENSHHTHEDGTPIQENIDADTGITDQVLLGEIFSYWGQSAIELPPQFSALRVTRGHKNDFSQKFIEDFVLWFNQKPKGLLGIPERWARKGTFL